MFHRYSVQKDGDEDVVVFKSAIDRNNPLHAEGEASAVINLGCGERPAFNCSDATELLTQLRFYALTTHIFGNDEARPTTIEEGEALFTKLAGEDPTFGYQVFCLRKPPAADNVVAQKKAAGKKKK